SPRPTLFPYTTLFRSGGFELRQRLPEHGEELRRIEDRRAVGFEVDEIDVASLQSREIAARRGRGRERRRMGPAASGSRVPALRRSEEHTSELQSLRHL